MRRCRRRSIAAEITRRTQPRRRSQTRRRAIAARGTRQTLVNTAEVLNIGIRRHRAWKLIRETSHRGTIMPHNARERIRRVDEAVKAFRTHFACIIAQLVLVSASLTRRREVRANFAPVTSWTYQTFRFTRSRHAAVTKVTSQTRKLADHSTCMRTKVTCIQQLID